MGCRHNLQHLTVYLVVCFSESKGLFTPRESERESEKDQRTIGKDKKKINGKHQRKFSRSLGVGKP